MRSIRKFIRGVPYSQNKVRGSIQGPQQWTQDVIRQTSRLPKIHGPCNMRVTFLLPPDKFPIDHPYGSDLDNLLKRFCDALKQTVLSEAPGGDGAIINIEVTKARVHSNRGAGAILELYVLPTT